MVAVGESSPAPVLPAGGAAGQYLARTAGGSAAWATPPAAADFAPPYATGLWYNLKLTGGQTSNAYTSQVGFTRYFPQWNPRAVAVTSVALAFNTATAGTSVLSFAVLRSALTAAGPIPTTPVASVANTTLGASSGTTVLTTSLTIPAGWVFFAYGNSGAPYTLTGYTPAVPYQLPVTTTQTPHTGAANGPCSYVVGAATPGTNPAVGNITLGASGAPVLWFKAA